jgi:peptidyl-prolyl cis-trans isomerase C
MKSERQTVRSEFFIMSRYLKEYIPHVIGGVLALNMSFLCADGLAVEKPTDSKNIAASVNGVPIVMSALTPQVDVNLKKYKKYGMGHGDKEMQTYLKKQALERLINTELLYQEAKKIKIEDLEERITESLSKIDEKQKNSEKYNKRKMRETLTKQIVIDEYLAQQKLIGVKVPEEEIMAYYTENKEAFRQEERIRSRHVLASVTSDDPKLDEKKAAYNKITEAQKLLQEGKPFADVAKEYSDCNSASNGGELGYHEKGYMPKAYDGVAFSLEPEKLSDIIETEHGYHIIEVLDHKPAGIQPYEEVKDFVTRYLKIQHRKKAMEDHISALRKKAKIDIYL